MTKHLLRLLAAALPWLPAIAQAEQPKLRICYESAEFKPYFNGTDEVPATDPGLVIEQLLLPAAARAGLTLELYRRPWNRCLNDMQNNLTDAIFPAAWTAERESWGRFPGPERNQASGVDPAYADWPVKYMIIVARDSTLEWDGSRFLNLQRGLGAPLGHLSSQRLQQLGALQSSNIKPETALNMILHQRLDGYVLEELTAQALINQSGLQEQLKVLQPPFYLTDWYVPVTHKFYAAQPERVWLFWESLVEQRHNLEIQIHGPAPAETTAVEPPPDY